jgi:hypothetical protein
VPSLEIIREDGTIPLTLKNQGTSYREVKVGLVLAKITRLPANQSSGVEQTSDGGESPPAVRVWHIPAHVASVNTVGTKHGKEWTSQQLIPEGVEDKSSGRGSDCKLYFADRKEPAQRPTAPIQAEVPHQAPTREVPEY